MEKATYQMNMVNMVYQIMCYLLNNSMEHMSKDQSLNDMVDMPKQHLQNKRHTVCLRIDRIKYNSRHFLTFNIAYRR